MSFAEAVVLLQMAISLLIAAQSPNVPVGLREQAISVANYAITVSNRVTAAPEFGAVIPVTAEPLPTIPKVETYVAPIIPVVEPVVVSSPLPAPVEPVVATSTIVSGPNAFEFKVISRADASFTVARVAVHKESVFVPHDSVAISVWRDADNKLLGSADVSATFEDTEISLPIVYSMRSGRDDRLRIEARANVTDNAAKNVYFLRLVGLK